MRDVKAWESFIARLTKEDTPAGETEKKDAVGFIADIAGIDEKHWKYMMEYIPSLRSLFEKIVAAWGM